MVKQIKVKDIKSMRDYSYNTFKGFMEVSNIITDNDIELGYKILDMFYGIKRKDAKLLSIEQYELLIKKVSDTFNDEIKLQNIIIMDGVQYGFIPKFDDITAGELIDLDSLLLEDKWIEIFSILYRPIVGEINRNGEYRIVEYTEYDDRFKDIDAYTAIAVKNFFYKSCQILNQHILISTLNKK